MQSRERWPSPPRLEPEHDWPPLWRECHYYDRLEVWRDPVDVTRATKGYVCAYANRRRRTLDALVSVCPPPARILDVAAAQGNFSIALAGLGYRVTWNDMRSELVGYVKRKAPTDASIEYIDGNFYDIEGMGPPTTWDGVVALEVIEHVAHPDRFIKALAALLRPGGAVVLSTPNGGYFLNNLPRFSDCPDPSVFESVQFKPNSDGHIFLLYEDELRRFAAEAGLEVHSIDFTTNPLTAGHIKLRYILSLLPDWTIRVGEALTGILPQLLHNRLSAQIIAVFTKPR